MKTITSRQCHSVKHFHTKVRGVTYNNGFWTSRQSIIQNCRVGELLQLVRDREDRDNLRVCRRRGEQIGWIEDSLAEDISEWLDDGFLVVVKISALTGGDYWGGKPTRGVNLLIEVFESQSAV